MKVIITKDYYFGSNSVSVTAHLEDITSQTLLRALSERGVCGVTITKAEGLGRLKDKTNGDQS